MLVYPQNRYVTLRSKLSIILLTQVQTRKQVVLKEKKDDFDDDDDDDTPPSVQPRLPDICPMYGCSDRLPTSPSPELFGLFSVRQKLFANHGRRVGRPQGINVNVLNICEQIKKDQEIPALKNQGLIANWPTKSDLDDAWEGMVKRVERMAPKVALLFDGDDKALEESAPWEEIQSFLARLTAAAAEEDDDDDPQPITLANVAASRMLQGDLRRLGRPG